MILAHCSRALAPGPGVPANRRARLLDRIEQFRPAFDGKPGQLRAAVCGEFARQLFDAICDWGVWHGWNRAINSARVRTVGGSSLPSRRYSTPWRFTRADVRTSTDERRTVTKSLGSCRAAQREPTSMQSTLCAMRQRHPGPFHRRAKRQMRPRLNPRRGPGAYHVGVAASRDACLIPLARPARIAPGRGCLLRRRERPRASSCPHV